jgi:hypothetical protein
MMYAYNAWLCGHEPRANTGRTNIRLRQMSVRPGAVVETLTKIFPAGKKNAKISKL